MAQDGDLAEINSVRIQDLVELKGHTKPARRMKSSDGSLGSAEGYQ